MTDFYPLILRAVSRLQNNTKEARLALYERVRQALLTKLYELTPPLTEDEVTRQRLAFEDSVRKFEAGAASLRASLSTTFLNVMRNLIAVPGPSKKLEAEFKEDLEQRLEEAEASVRATLEESKRLQQEIEEVLSEANKSGPWKEALRAHANEKPDDDELREARVRLFRTELAEAASPAPSIALDGRLDAGPNESYDAPLDGTELASLPLRQRALIRTIASDLPRNSPRYLRIALKNYDEELMARGVKPILGLLKDMAAIIESTVGAHDAAEWLDKGLVTAFDRLATNHEFFVKHFPLDPKREALYQRTPVDESNATEANLSNPFQQIAEATSDANKAGIATDDFLRVVDKLAEFAKIIGTLPHPTVAPKQPPRHDSAHIPASPSAPKFKDKIIAEERPISPRKRLLLSGLGFFERAYNLLGSTASLMSIPGADKLLKVLHDAISALSRLIG